MFRSRRTIFESLRRCFNSMTRFVSEVAEHFGDCDDVKRYQLTAPRIIVVGLTSAGKSSLLERVIGVRYFRRWMKFLAFTALIGKMLFIIQSSVV